jgi:histone H3/H4
MGPTRATLQRSIARNHIAIAAVSEIRRQMTRIRDRSTARMRMDDALRQYLLEIYVSVVQLLEHLPRSWLKRPSPL